MKKIMFNDRYGLTQAVLEGRKTQTRRILNPTMLLQYPCGAYAGHPREGLSGCRHPCGI